MSFWSKPFLNRPNFNLDGKHMENTLACWSLSTALAKQHFSSVELYTDSIGSSILCDKLQLPFDKVHVVLDTALKYVSDRMWCAGKLVAQSFAEAPYVHIDNDHFQLTPFKEEFKDILGFCVAGFPESCFYHHTIKFLKNQNFPFTQDELADIDDITNFSAISCGVVGFQDNKQKELYIQHAWDFLSRLQATPEYIHYAEGNSNDFNCLVEQWMLALVAKVYDLDVVGLVKGLKRAAQTRAGIYHPYAEAKQKPSAQKFIRDLLIEKFPHYYMNFQLNTLR